MELSFGFVVEPKDYQQPPIWVPKTKLVCMYLLVGGGVFAGFNFVFVGWIINV